MHSTLSCSIAYQSLCMAGELQKFPRRTENPICPGGMECGPAGRLETLKFSYPPNPGPPPSRASKESSHTKIWLGNLGVLYPELEGYARRQRKKAEYNCCT